MLPTVAVTVWHRKHSSAKAAASDQGIQTEYPVVSQTTSCFITHFLFYNLLDGKSGDHMGGMRGMGGGMGGMGMGM